MYVYFYLFQKMSRVPILNTCKTHFHHNCNQFNTITRVSMKSDLLVWRVLVRRFLVRRSSEDPCTIWSDLWNVFWVSIIRSKRYKMWSRDFIHATWPPAHDLASNNFGQSLDLDPTTFKLGDKLDIKLEIKFRFRTSQKIRHILQFLY